MLWSRATAVVFLVLLTTPASAAGVRNQGPTWDEARGCYAYRGRMHCSRYCWRDMNGHRYCHERAREARPHTLELFERTRPRDAR